MSRTPIRVSVITETIKAFTISPVLVQQYNGCTVFRIFGESHALCPVGKQDMLVISSWPKISRVPCVFLLILECAWYLVSASIEEVELLGGLVTIVRGT